MPFSTGSDKKGEKKRRKRHKKIRLFPSAPPHPFSITGETLAGIFSPRWVSIAASLKRLSQRLLLLPVQLFQSSTHTFRFKLLRHRPYGGTGGSRSCSEAAPFPGISECRRGSEEASLQKEGKLGSSAFSQHDRRLNRGEVGGIQLGEGEVICQEMIVWWLCKKLRKKKRKSEKTNLAHFFLTENML